MNTSPFYTKEAVHINKARIQHFDTLNLNLNKKTVLETGCGAKGDFTKHLLSLGAYVTVTDARKNIVQILTSTIKVKGFVSNLNEERCLKGIYDYVFCYGTLYHLSNPVSALYTLSKSCKEGIIISTCVDPVKTQFVFENENDPTQSVDGLGFRPTRKWVMNELSNYFKYVYVSRKQPDHPEFPLDWSVSPKPNTLIRAVFIGSHTPLSTDSWSNTLLVKQTT